MHDHSRIEKDFSLRPVIGLECEFYAEPAETPLTIAHPLWQALRQRAQGEEIALHTLEAERGRNQFEFSIAHTPDVSQLIADYETLKILIANVLQREGFQASFLAKPYADQPGSGLHVHVHLEDAAGTNVFLKDDVSMSEPLKKSLYGLLATMQRNLPVFAPHPESFARFRPGGNAPTTISWGANNRTVALRLPDKFSHHKHIEHRVSGADADAGAVIAAILRGMHAGLSQAEIALPPQIHGDASLDMYGLERLAPQP